MNMTIIEGEPNNATGVCRKRVRELVAGKPGFFPDENHNQEARPWTFGRIRLKIGRMDQAVWCLVAQGKHVFWVVDESMKGHRAQLSKAQAVGASAYMDILEETATARTSRKKPQPCEMGVSVIFADDGGVWDSGKHERTEVAPWRNNNVGSVKGPGVNVWGFYEGHRVLVCLPEQTVEIVAEELKRSRRILAGEAD